jgi:hypothetical protein
VPDRAHLAAASAIALLAVSAGGCGSGDTLESCAWPVESSRPAGEIELGTGIDGFEPMPDALPFILGTQGGTFLVLHARMRGLEPGNPEDLLDPDNPRTRFSGILFDGTVVGRECPSTTAYQPAAEAGTFERQQWDQLEFLPFALGEGAFDTTVRLRVEVIDSLGRYASDEKDVLCRAPDDWTEAGAASAAAR